MPLRSYRNDGFARRNTRFEWWQTPYRYRSRRRVIAVGTAAAPWPDRQITLSPTQAVFVTSFSSKNSAGGNLVNVTDGPSSPFQRGFETRRRIRNGTSLVMAESPMPRLGHDTHEIPGEGRCSVCRPNLKPAMGACYFG